MATTTPNYGWPVPTSTDYVKDGATAIEALGDAIDATVFGLGSGMTLITAQTFTTSSAVNVNNCFSATYQNYRIVGNLTAASANNENVDLRLRVGGVDNSGATSYQRSLLRSINGTVTGAYLAVSNSLVCQTNTTVFGSFAADIYNPFSAAPTKLTNNFVSGGSGTVADYLAQTACYHNVSSSFDGFSIIPASGTISGTLRVYGYQN
jgi:hypothetical protein